MVKVRLNGVVFTLAWAEFEKAMTTKGVTTSVEILEMR
jgi:hypothetical protein